MTGARAGGAGGGGLVDRMRRTWVDPRGGVRAEIAAAAEARLLFYVMAASAFAVLGAVGAQLVRPAAGVAAADLDQWITTQVVVGLFFRPLGFYAVAALIALACRRLGGSGGWRDTRVAVFWTALTVAPAAAALTVAGAALAAAGADAGVAAAAQAAGSLLWAALLAPGLAEAHGFRKAWHVLAGLAAVGAALAGLTVALSP